MGKYQIQEPIASTIYEIRLLLDGLGLTLEALEVYIEKKDPHFRNKRQIFNKGIKDESGPAWDYKDLFGTRLLIFTGMIKKTHSPDTRNYVRKEFYKWFYNTGITGENCPENLSRLLIVIDRTLYSDNEKNMKNKNQFTLQDATESIQKGERKKYDELRIQIFEGEWEKGREILEELKKRYYNKHHDYSILSLNEQQNIDEMEVDTADDTSQQDDKVH
ncbi:15132_t:CDS:2 [Acaulospora colombiana]|uniref:15132_t:CDS:1 n=1 Tax=Acaulospora colombiana TaxID=27376 RepID=A0ACA9LJ31_9GLOM|nr:15132_t:CDS:2 [Acaulospora colombiana]